MKTKVKIDVQDLDQLGIIPGIVDEIEILETINKEIGTNVRDKVSIGQKSHPTAIKPVEKKLKAFRRKGVQLLVFSTIVATSATTTFAILNFLPIEKQRQLSVSTPPEISTTVSAVSAEGGLEPEGEIIRLFAPSSPRSPNPRIEKLLVKRGDFVKTGQLIAILDNRDSLSANLLKAQKQVVVAEASLKKVKAGSQKGDINARKANIATIKAERVGQTIVQTATIERLGAELLGEQKAQQATIERLNAQLNNAIVECDRYQQLFTQSAISTSIRDSKCLLPTTAKQQVLEAQASLNRIVSSRNEQIKEATATLKRIITTSKQQELEAIANLDRTQEIRPEDVVIARVELANVKATVLQAQAELRMAYVYSPQAGQILNVNTRPGEIVSRNGIVEIGQTSQMYVRAEIYETDIAKVKIGQRAMIMSKGFEGKLTGTVEDIGLKIAKKDVLGTDPVADSDARVVEVKIRLNLSDSKKVAGLTNLKVKLVIKTDPIEINNKNHNSIL
jgi:HlyD family secretion protein